MSRTVRAHRHRDRALRDNTARVAYRIVKLNCGHKVDALPTVSTPVGRPNLYFCPEGCGLRQGTTKR